jgi:tetratricopeptide (TPR) repeat protein
MQSLSATIRHRSARQWVLLSLRALIVVCAAAILVPQVVALYHWYAATSALAKYHASDALSHFHVNLRIWPWSRSVRGHLLASRAARRNADYEEARQQLSQCQSLLKGTNTEVALEDALLRAAMGDLEEVEGFLRQRSQRDPLQASLCLEALAEGFTRLYRIPEALACLGQWLEFEPGNPQPHYLRGKLYFQINGWEKAATDLRRAIELDPERDEARDRLARVLLELSRYGEAMEQLEYLRKKNPDDRDVLVRMARAYHGQGQSKQARQLLEEVLQTDPDNGMALFMMGKILLMSGQPEEAEVWLRRAVRVQLYDYQSNFQLYQALSRQEGRSAEAQEQLIKAEKLLERRTHLSEVRNKLAGRPHDPALHYEMGTLLMQLGDKDLGAKWLASALREQEDYQPALLALADYFDSIGETERAAEHREKAQAATSRGK